jgi:hypothetical protein
LIKKQMSAAQDQFDKLVERLKLEHQSRLKEPKAELEAIKLLTEKEHRRACRLLAPGTPASEPAGAIRRTRHNEAGAGR